MFFMLVNTDRRIQFKGILAAVIMFTVMLAAFGCKSRSAPSVSGNGFYFDTIVTFTVYGTEDQSIIDELKKECERYEKIFSPTDKESELYKLNAGETVEVSEELYQCVKKALEFSRLTEGRYDISIRPVSSLWDFKSSNPKVPDVKNVQAALTFVDYSKIDVSEENIIKIETGMQIDLGSLAKGYIGNRLCLFLKNKGVTSAVISLGGNVSCLGEKTGEDGGSSAFSIGVKSPFPDDEAGFADILAVRDSSVITSGIYERCFEKDNVLYHHILDACTGFPVDNDLASVTIVSSSGFEADILSTVCFLEGYENTLNKFYGKGFVEPFEAEFIFRDGSVKKTKGFDALKS